MAKATTRSISKVRDSGQLYAESSNTLTFDVIPVNDAPTTSPVTLTPVAEDSGIRVITQAELLANASDVDGDMLTATGLAITSGNGTLVGNGDGTWNYTPDANDDSDVSFNYTITDGTENVAADATLDITPVNDVPTTSPVTLTPIAEDSGVRIITQAELLANASDVDGDTLTATGLSITSGNGILVDNGDGTWSYTSAADDDTNVSFSYNVTDGTDNVAGNATLDITPANDAPTTSPVALAPIAEDSGTRVITQAELLANVSDVDGDMLTATGLAITSGNGTLVDNGDGTWNYTPAANDDTDVSFSYTVTDGTDNVTGNATLDITPVNDAPTDLAPISIAIPENTDTSGGLTVATLTANDVDAGDSLRYSIIDGGDSANFSIIGDQLVFNDGVLNFEAKPTYSVTVLVTDSQGATTQEVIVLNVEDLQEAPVAADDNYQTAQATALTGDVLANDFDGDNDTLTTALTQAPSNAASFTLNADGSFSYVPNAEFFGTDTFTYSISDGNGGTDSATVSITVTQVNNLPIAQSDTFEIVPGQTNSSVVSVLANDIDIDGNGLVAVLVGNPTNGSLTLGADGNFVYTPDAGFTGEDSFTYVANDGSGNSVATTVVLRTSAGIPSGVGSPVDLPATPATPVGSDATDEQNETDDKEDIDNSSENNSESDAAIGLGITPLAQNGDRTSFSRDTEDESFESETSLTNELIQIMGDQREAQAALATILARFSGAATISDASELDDIINSAHLKFVFDAQYLWGEIDEQIESTNFETFSVTVGAVSAVGTIGVVLWTLRGGALMAVALSQIPTWGMIDPLPVLDSYSSGRVKKSDDEFSNFF